MGGGAVLEGMAGLCHHSEEVHVEQFEVKMMPKGELEQCNVAYTPEHTSRALFTVCMGTKAHLHNCCKSIWHCLRLT